MVIWRVVKTDKKEASQVLFFIFYLNPRELEDNGQSEKRFWFDICYCS